MFFLPNLIQINVLRHFVWLSLLALHFTEYSLLASIYAEVYKYNGDTLLTDFRESFIDYKIFANILNEIALTVNFIVTVISWVLIMPWILMSEENSIYVKIDQSLLHSLPFLFSLINIFVLSDTVVYYSDTWAIMLVAACYLTGTYYFTKKSGLLVYYFLTWKDGDTFSTYFSVFAVILTIVTHNSFAFLTQSIRGRSEIESKWWE